MQDQHTTGARLLIAALEDAGTEVVFGIPGGAILPAYDPLMESSIRHVLVRHEQAAGHAAEGYALATGRVGVCIATSGPGATNLVTPLADAFMDSVPIVAITGQVSEDHLGTDAFQSADICGITMPITKHNLLVTEARDIGPSIAKAFHLASTGRPGPVLVDIAKSALLDSAAVSAVSAPPATSMPGYHPVVTPPARSIDAAVTEIRRASRPVLYVGGGVIRAGASRELRDLVEVTGIPVVTTLTARGALPDDHPLHLGMPGMHGTVPAVAALQLSDLVIALGARFDDRVTGDPATFAPRARVVHVDIDPAEIGKNRRADVPIVADCKIALELLVEAARAALPGPDLADWHRRLMEFEDRYPLGYEQRPDGPLAPQYVIQRLGELAGGPDTIFTTGVGQHQMWASQFLSFQEPSTWLSSGGLGTMGFGIPAAMGAQLGRPESAVWCIDGDGCFQMTNQELATCALEGIPIKVALINNGSLGMVRQLQTLYYDERVNSVDLGSRRLRPIPDYVKLADALGISDITGLTSALSAKATPAQIDAAIEAVIGMAPSDLDTLKEIADRLVGAEDDYAALVLVIADKADASTTYTKTEVDDALGEKADLVAGKVPGSQLPDPPSVPVKASGAELRALANDAKFLTPKAVADAAALVTLTDAATIAVDMEAGTNFVVTLGGNRTLGAPTNAKPGTSGTILIKQPSSGGPRTLAYASAWVPFGSTPALSTAASAVDLLTWFVEASGKVRFALQKGGAA